MNKKVHFKSPRDKIRVKSESKFFLYIKIWGFCCLPFVVFSFLLKPEKLSGGEYSFMPQCLSKFFFQTECIGCGFTRAICLFAHGRLEESLNVNKIACVIFMLILIINIFLAVELFQKYKSLSMLKLRQNRNPGSR